MRSPADSVRVREVFERDPGRRIDPIVRIDLHDPEVIRTELEEYVVTDEIKKDFSEIIDVFIGSRNSTPESVCGWISGFFGSGKSHFLKILGYILSNKRVKMDDGTIRGASLLFCNKHSILKGLMLDRELKTKAIFVNMLTFDTVKSTSITRIIYEAMLRELGLSNVDWIAEIERTIKKDGLWEKFLGFVREKEGKDWQEVRTMQIKARPLIVSALNELDPQRFPDPRIADKSIDDVQKSLRIDQNTLAERLLEIAEDMDPVNGRVVVLLDEVGLYVGANADRLNDLNSVAEHITKIGKGKLWLFVTAQEALEEALPKVLGYTDQFQKIKDRFQIKIELTPENIDTVVKKRLLQKKIGSEYLGILTNMYHMYVGNLTTAALIKNPARDYHNLFTQLDYERFIEYYPLLPYQIRLMQEIFGLLRARGGTPQTLSGRERAVLQVVRSLLLGLANYEVGRIATFDMVYDVINEELKIVRSAQHAIIEKDIADLGHIGQIAAASVAKSLFLIQTVSQWLPCTAENIAATLFSHIKTDRNDHLTDVKKCLQVLVDGKWIAEEQGKYRFLSEIERSFEQDIERQSITERDKRELSNEVIKQVLSEMKTYNYHSTRTFDIHILADDQEVNSKGHVKLEFFSPRRVASDKELLESLRRKSTVNRETLFWISKNDERYDDTIQRARKLEKALEEKERGEQSDEEIPTLDKHKRDLDHMIHDQLPKILEKAANSGTIIYQGEDYRYNGTSTINNIFIERIKKLIEEVFTEFSIADYRVERDEHIGNILTWQSGKLPKIYHDLQLVDDEAHNILVDRPVASRVLTEVRKRSNQDSENQTGASIADYFEGAPFGWDPKIVRLALATLFKNGSILVNVAGRDYLSPTDNRSHDAFLTTRTFSKARFMLGQEVSKDQRKQASDLLDTVFGEHGGNTKEEVDQAIIKAIKNRIDECARLVTIAREQNLPLRKGLDQLHRTMKQILEANTVTRRILLLIDETNMNVIRQEIPVLDKLLKFEKNKNLQKYYSIRNFLDKNEPGLISVGEDENVSTIFKNIKEALNSQEFLGQWPDIYGKFQTLLHRYETVYSEKHEHRDRLAKEAVQKLKLLPAFSGPLKNEAEQKLTRLHEFECSVEKQNIDEENTVCKVCKSTLKDITHHIEMIPGREHQISMELADMWSDRDHVNDIKDKVQGFQITISSLKEMDAVTRKLKDLSDYAIKQRKSLKIKVEVN